MAALVKAEGLVKRFEDVVAVNGLDLFIDRGECFGLLGPNGAGKTTTVEMLEGLTSPDSGTISLFDMSWGTGHDREIRARLGVQLQETQLGEKLTVEETLRLFRSMYPQGRTPSEVIALLELEEKRNSQVGKLSGGQKQRLALGCALVSKPEILFLDEPTTGLDPQARRKVWEIVERFRGEGGTVLLTTHYMDEAAQLAGRIAIVDHGQVIAEGSPQELIAKLEAADRIELEIQGSFDAELLKSVDGVASASRAEDKIVIAAQSAAASLPNVLRALSTKGVEPISIATRHATLEDVFIHLTGRGLRDD
jgi:ABC-2 type transport system ATP-binding protein